MAATYLEGIHKNADWPMGIPWAAEQGFAEADETFNLHIEQITPTIRVGHYAYGTAEERTLVYQGVTYVEVWTSTQPNNPFLKAPA